MYCRFCSLYLRDIIAFFAFVFFLYLKPTICIVIHAKFASESRICKNLIFSKLLCLKRAHGQRFYHLLLLTSLIFIWLTPPLPATSREWKRRREKLRNYTRIFKSIFNLIRVFRQLSCYFLNLEHPIKLGTTLVRQLNIDTSLVRRPINLDKALMC